MNTSEKLEQSGIVKEKGTQYFKVCFEGARSLSLTRAKILSFNVVTLHVAGGKIQAGICAVQKDRFLAGTRVWFDRRG